MQKILQKTQQILPTKQIFKNFFLVMLREELGQCLALQGLQPDCKMP